MDEKQEEIYVKMNVKKWNDPKEGDFYELTSNISDMFEPVNLEIAISQKDYEKLKASQPIIAFNAEERDLAQQINDGISDFNKGRNQGKDDILRKLFKRKGKQYNIQSKKILTLCDSEKEMRCEIAMERIKEDLRWIAKQEKKL